MKALILTALFLTAPFWAAPATAQANDAPVSQGHQG